MSEIDQTLPWFFAEFIPGDGETLTLDARETQHASGSKRRKERDQIMLFDGAGTIASVTIQSLDSKRTGLSVCIGVKRKVDKPSDVHLVTAIPKGDRQSVLLDMVTQLGVTKFTPLLCDRSQQKVSSSQTKRWKRIVVEACKQSRRAWLPEIADCLTVEELIASVDAKTELCVAHPSDDGFPDAFEFSHRSMLIVGPEGGFSNHELRQFESAEARLTCLSNNVLRIETAAVAIVCAAVK